MKASSPAGMEAFARIPERIAAAVEELKALIRTLGGDPQEGLAED